MDEKLEQQIIVCFLVKSGKMNKKSKQSCQLSSLKKWAGHFRTSRDSIEDNAQEGRPRTLRNAENVELVQTTIKKNRQMATREVADRTNINRETVQQILHNKLVRKKRPDLWIDGWLLHHNNALAHSAVLMCTFLMKNCITVLEHPPYSPDLAPCDFFLFPKLKDIMKGQHYKSVEDLQAAASQVLKEIPAEAFVASYDAWRKCMLQCINAEGEYFEGNHVEIESD